MSWIGLILGALIGAYVHGFGGMLVGAAIGWVIGFLLRNPPFPAIASATEQANTTRIVALEQRLSALESLLRREGIAPVPSTEAPAEPGVAAERRDVVATPWVEAATAQMPRLVTPAPSSPVRKGGSGDPRVEPSASAAGARPSAARATAGAAPDTTAARSLWSWFIDGNAMVRIGVVILFFGVAFLLSYLAEHVTIPIELQFTAVALVGAALIGAGLWLRGSRRAYALALAGGGLGVLYLTTFAAFQLVPLLAPATAFALLAAIALLAIALSLAFDAQALAALALLGGLLAPVLVETVTEPLLLFGYVAAVNALVLVIAWFRAWRALDIVGFVGTFVLGLWWGYEFYAPEHFALIEPFLAGFFLAYVAVPILHSFRGAGERKIDAVLIFGVPIVGLALQALLLYDSRYGLAWTTAIVAVMYGLLWGALRKRTEDTARLLAAAFGGLSVIFATLTVPLAIDARWTSAAWAIEAAGVYWFGCREDRRFARAFAVLLQFATGIMFVLGGFREYSELAFLNRQFLGIAAISLAGFASVCFGDRRGDTLPRTERVVMHFLFAWACIWWLGGGLTEIARHLAPRLETHAMLAWVAGSVAAGALLVRPLRWPRLDVVAVVLLPGLAFALGHDVTHGRTSLLDYGWAVYPLAWALHFALVHRAEARRAGPATPGLVASEALHAWLTIAHLAGVLLLLGQIAWEAGEWTARATPRGTVWSACAHLWPLALYLLTVTKAAQAAWPMRGFGQVYRLSAGTVVAVALGLGFVVLAVLNPGETQPLPYVPLANPLELTLGFALVGLYLWARHAVRAEDTMVYPWIGMGVFILLNGIVARTVHHWLAVPWRLQDLIASRPLQAALTLAWTAAALAAMVVATQRRLRVIWLIGAGLLAAVVIKLFAIDLAALAGLSRVVAFLGVGVLLLVIGYVAPLPPADAKREEKVPTANEVERSQAGI